MTSDRPAQPTPAPPTATYRLQLQPRFPFAAAEAAVPYVARLGVSHLHLSPVLEAVPGSAHGYDVVDHARVRAELGGEDGLRALSRTAREHGLGLVLDIVPNHMAAAARYNRPLWEVLREGPSSRYARWFDVDWEAHGGRILLPVLGRPLGRELAELRVVDGTLRYHDHEFPLREGTERLPLPRLLDAQWYRLCWWRLARTEVNYRRFFTLSELIGVRVEDPEVFAATHAKVLQLLHEGVAEGLRVDHPDGLADPGGYLRRLDEATGGRWTVVEKILADGERLPSGWAVAGTTGYDALRQVDGVFVDPGGARELLGLYRRYADPPADRGGEWAATARRAARRVVTQELAAEVDRLTRACAALCARDPALCDHAPWALRTALCELLVRLPVYRVYDDADTAGTLTEDVAARARRAFSVPEEAAAVNAVRGLLLHGDGPERRALRARFSQVASALRAKSVEDAAYYRYVPLLSANEVGGAPGTPWVTPEAFHDHCARVQRTWPLTGTVLSTHDTKRSADVRAVISALTECPARWARLLADVDARAERDDEAPPPDAQVAWAAWQTALGMGVTDPGRLRAALLKHVREAGLTTSWTEPDEAYEAAVAAFVVAGPCGPSRSAVREFRNGLESQVRANVLGAALLHLTMPGVPELYQGTEREYLALVDPDNRRTPAFGRDRPDDALVSADLSAQKTALTTAALRLRARRPEVFGARATYEPVRARGASAAHCLAFTRSGEVLTAVTRLSLRLAEDGGWRDTRVPLPDGRWQHLLTHEYFTGAPHAAALFAHSPAALLEHVG